MPKLIIDDGPLSGKTYVVARKKPFLIGRGDVAQIELQDTLVSRRHCQIEVRGSQFFARDLGSRNGTFINGRRITFAALYNKDQLRIGSSTFTFHSEARDDSLVNTTLGGYQINALIGRGGMGSVYRATQLSLGRMVALKVLSPELAKDGDFVKLFLNEARSAAALDHPNLVKVYEVGSVDGTHYFSMEFIPGGSVEEKVSCSGQLPVDEALDITRQAADGLAYVSSKNLVHRDIKPGNLLLNLEGIVKICDLGICGKINLEEEDSFRGGGSPHFIAPEQALGRKVDARADIYSLGVSLYTILAGHTPFTGSSSREIARKHVKELPPPLTDQRAGLPKEVCQLVHWMIEKLPTERPESASVVSHRLAHLLGGKRQHHPFQPTHKPITSLLATAAAIILAIAIGLIFAFGYIRGKKEEAWQSTLDTLRKDADQLVQSQSYDQAIKMLNQFKAAHTDRAETLAWIDDKIALAETLDKKEKQAAREAAAATLLEELSSNNVDVNGLKQFIEQYSDTPAAHDARQRMKQMVQAEASRKRLEAQADKECKRVLAESDAYLKDKNFQMAHDILSIFPRMFAKTQAYQKLQAQKKAILEQAGSHMKSVIAEAMAAADRADHLAAQQVLNALKLPRSLLPQVDAARKKVKTQSDAAEIRLAKAAHDADRDALFKAQGAVRHMLVRMGFKEARQALAQLLPNLKTREAQAATRERITHLDGLHLFFLGIVNKRLDTPRRFALMGDAEVLVIRLLDHSVEFYKQAKDKRAQRKSWPEIAPDKMVALLSGFAKTDAEKKCCQALADEFKRPVPE